MDIDQFFGEDVTLSNTGDLNTVTGTDMSQQRVLRRLLSNPAYVDINGNYTAADLLFHPDYGAGLGRFIGSTTALDEIRALILEQLALESAVAQTPSPVVNLAWVDPVTLNCDIRYADAETGESVVLNFNINQ